MERNLLIRSLFDSSGKGLEIGASYNPIVPKLDGFQVDIVDHLSTSDLRSKYAHEKGVDVSRIEEVDYIWDGRPLSQVIERKGYYDYIVASHVIEHTPDLLGFLVECEILLSHNGVLVLAVPDKRRCFDLFRPLSTTGSVLQAHVERRVRHTPAIAFDQVAYSATILDEAGLNADTDIYARLNHSLAFAQAVFDRSVSSNDYFDFHAWVFSPSSFRMILKDLYDVGQLKLRESQFQTAEHEFYVTLSPSACGCNLTREELLHRTDHELTDSFSKHRGLALASIIEAEAPESENRSKDQAAENFSVNELGTGEPRSVNDQALSERLQCLAAEDDAALQQADQKAAEAACRIATLEAQVAAFRNSTFWRLTAPARAIVQFLGLGRGNFA